MQDLKNRLNVVPALNPTAGVKASVTGLTIDTFDYEGVLFAVEVGPTGDTLSGSTYFEFDIQTSPDGVNWSAAADQFVQYAVGTANGAANTGCLALLQASNANAQVLLGGYINFDRYLRLNVVVTGTMANGTPMSAVAILGYGRHQPVAYSGVNQRP